MNFLLRLKHWQLFSLVIGVALVTQIFLFISIFTGATLLAVTLGLIVSVFIMWIFLGWIWTLGNELFPKLPEQHGLILNKFKILLLIPICYISAVILYAYLGISLGFTPGIDSDDLQTIFPFVIIPLHLLSMFGIFYSLYFISKSLKTVELQRPVSFNDYAGEFFLIWFFPIGIWFIQPRINNIFRKTL